MIVVKVVVELPSDPRAIRCHVPLTSHSETSENILKLL